MTSYTKKLFNRDPHSALAAEDFARHSRTVDNGNNYGFRGGLSYGKSTQLAQFTYAFHPNTKPFGKRKPGTLREAMACQERCTHPGCSEGCTGLGRV